MESSVPFWVWWGIPPSWARFRAQLKWEVTCDWSQDEVLSALGLVSVLLWTLCNYITALLLEELLQGEVTLQWQPWLKLWFFFFFFHLSEDCLEGQNQELSPGESNLLPKSPSVRESLWALIYHGWGSWSLMFSLMMDLPAWRSVSAAPAFPNSEHLESTLQERVRSEQQNIYRGHFSICA